MEYKVVISDAKTGKSYQVEVADDKAKKLRNLKIGDSLEGTLVGVPGYKLEITGGSDRGGFPMKKGIHSQNPTKILMGNGVGFKAKNGQRARRRVHGEQIGETISQINTKVIDYGGKDLESLLGKKDGSEENKEDN